MAKKGKHKLTRVHHIGVTVRDAQKAVDEWAEAFGFEGKVVDIPENKMKIGVVEVVGVTFFLNEYTDPDRKAKAAEGLDLPVHFSGHNIVNSFGEGISHISFETTDLDYMMQQAEDAGMRAKFDEHRDALEGMCNFVEPDDARIPIEFMEAVEGRENPLD